jgi:hypothetical protein
MSFVTFLLGDLPIHTKTPQIMELSKKKFAGMDNSNEISLLDLGLLVYADANKDGSGTHFCVYKMDDDTFGCGHISQADLNELLEGKSWADNKSIASFFSWGGIVNPAKYIAQDNLTLKLSDLIGYYGTENIFGTEMSPMNAEEVTEKYL